MSSRVVNVQVKGLQDVQAAISAYGQDVADAVARAVQATAVETVSDVKRMIERGAKTGTTYYRIPGDKYMTIRAGSADGPPVAFIPGGGKRNLSAVHRASAPGEAPAKDTGDLIKSIYYRKIDADTAAIGSQLKYAFRLEFGTRKMAARPSWVPAAEKNALRLQKRLTRIIREATARAGGKTA